MSKVAIIGSGISGLGAAFLLHRQHDITVYEKNDYVGGHTRTRLIEHGGKTIAVDTGFIVFNHQNYPNLCGLFKHLSVPSQKSDMTFGITINNGAIEWGANNLNAVFGQRSNLVNPKFWRFLFDILRFNRKAYATAQRHPELTLKQLLDKLGMSDWFARYYILPMGGAIWSCSLEAMLSFPAITFVQFFKAHGLLSVIGQPQWYTVTGGSHEYVKRLTTPFADRIRTNCGVTRINRSNGTVNITDTQGNTQEYDQVVLACHADQALSMLTDATAQEREILGAFKYSKNLAVLHKDASIMPTRKRCWSSWIYHSQNEDTSSAIPVTYWMNLLQSIDHAHPVFVTLNPHRAIAKEHIFDEHMFEHPIYSEAAIAAQGRIASIQGQNNTWFCGAYQRNGFHEDGLASAVAVAKGMKAEVRWA